MDESFTYNVSVTDIQIKSLRTEFYLQDRRGIAYDCVRVKRQLFRSKSIVKTRSTV